MSRIVIARRRFRRANSQIAPRVAALFLPATNPAFGDVVTPASNRPSTGGTRASTGSPPRRGFAGQNSQAGRWYRVLLVSGNNVYYRQTVNRNGPPVANARTLIMSLEDFGTQFTTPISDDDR